MNIRGIIFIYLFTNITQDIWDIFLFNVIIYIVFILCVRHYRKIIRVNIIYNIMSINNDVRLKKISLYCSGKRKAFLRLRKQYHNSKIIFQKLQDIIVDY